MNSFLFKALSLFFIMIASPALAHFSDALQICEAAHTGRNLMRSIQRQTLNLLQSEDTDKRTSRSFESKQERSSDAMAEFSNDTNAFNDIIYSARIFFLQNNNQDMSPSAVTSFIISAQNMARERFKDLSENAKEVSSASTLQNYSETWRKQLISTWETIAQLPSQETDIGDQESLHLFFNNVSQAILPIIVEEMKFRYAIEICDFSLNAISCIEKIQGTMATKNHATEFDNQTFSTMNVDLTNNILAFIMVISRAETFLLTKDKPKIHAFIEYAQSEALRRIRAFNHVSYSQDIANAWLKFWENISTITFKEPETKNMESRNLLLKSVQDRSKRFIEGGEKNSIIDASPRNQKARSLRRHNRGSSHSAKKREDNSNSKAAQKDNRLERTQSFHLTHSTLSRSISKEISKKTARTAPPQIPKRYDCWSKTTVNINNLPIIHSLGIHRFNINSKKEKVERAIILE